jgi:hypothetical protein
MQGKTHLVKPRILYSERIESRNAERWPEGNSKNKAHADSRDCRAQQNEPTQHARTQKHRIPICYRRTRSHSPDLDYYISSNSCCLVNSLVTNTGSCGTTHSSEKDRKARKTNNALAAAAITGALAAALCWLSAVITAARSQHPVLRPAHCAAPRPRAQTRRDRVRPLRVRASARPPPSASRAARR